MEGFNDMTGYFYPAANVHVNVLPTMAQSDVLAPRHSHAPSQHQQHGQHDMIAPELLSGELDIHRPPQNQTHPGAFQNPNPAFDQSHQTVQGHAAPVVQDRIAQRDILAFICEKVARLEFLAYFGLQRRQEAGRLMNPTHYLCASASYDALHEAAESMKSAFTATRAFVNEQQKNIQSADDEVKETIDIMRKAIVDKNGEIAQMQKEIARKDEEIMALRGANNILIRTVQSLQHQVSDLNLQLDLTEQDSPTQQITPPRSQTEGGGASTSVRETSSIAVKRGMQQLTLDLSEQPSPDFHDERIRRHWNCGGMEALDNGVLFL
ncbi:uncharacterized protein PAC_18998 [Phialocephala subalpina]|uniref:Uncharacterized protein n=1 Tax=Phialocephala subalpina TaxID=576137 RepID=A0A1L7XVR3_9HELO|nr:uncharacterized protein PAC_18998 [Phialocephala subalpina]